MNLTTIENGLINWISENSLMSPIIITESGTITADDIVVKINNDTITESFDTDKETTLTNLCASIEVLSYITSCDYDFSNNLITIISDYSVKIYLDTENSDFTGTLAFENQKSLVILDYQDSPRPDYNYAAISLSAFNNNGFNDQTYYNSTTGAYTVQGQREFICSVQFFGLLALEYANNLLMSLNFDYVNDMLNTYNLVIYDNEPIMNVTALLDSQYEKRSAIDFYCRTTDSANDFYSGAIETVNSNLDIT